MPRNEQTIMTDTNGETAPIAPPTAPRSATTIALHAAIDAFLAAPATAIDRRGCADLAAVVADWEAELRCERGDDDPTEKDSCFSHARGLRRREKTRLELLAAEELAATLRTLAASGTSLAPAVLHAMVARFAEGLRDRDDPNALFGRTR